MSLINIIVTTFIIGIEIVLVMYVIIRIVEWWERQ
jgi:hypothetical protein